MADYVVRAARVDDAPIVARHRVCMFLDMGELSESEAPNLEAASRRLMLALMDWCRTQNLTRITLHASQFGRPVYERLGFTPTNEMRLVLKH